MQNIFDDADVISSYSRQQAINDGTLVDASKMAREAGITFPVALTAAAWSLCVAWSDSDAIRTGAVQDEAGRLWDVVSMLRHAIRTSGSSDRITYRVAVVPRDSCKRSKPLPQTLCAFCGPGDDAEPVITVMLPEES